MNRMNRIYHLRKGKDGKDARSAQRPKLERWGNAKHLESWLLQHGQPGAKVQHSRQQPGNPCLQRECRLAASNQLGFLMFLQDLHFEQIWTLRLHKVPEWTWSAQLGGSLLQLHKQVNRQLAWQARMYGRHPHFRLDSLDLKNDQCHMLLLLDLPVF